MADLSPAVDTAAACAVGSCVAIAVHWRPTGRLAEHNLGASAELKRGLLVYNKFSIGDSLMSGKGAPFIHPDTLEGVEVAELKSNLARMRKENLRRVLLDGVYVTRKDIQAALRIRDRKENGGSAAKNK
jgi:hypothetical protein